MAVFTGYSAVAEFDKVFVEYEHLLNQKPDMTPRESAPVEQEEETTSFTLEKIPVVVKTGYVPRKLPGSEFSGLTDVEFMALAYKHRRPALLFGAPGAGKTALIEASMPNVVTISGSADTELSDFVGSWVQRTDGTYAWVDGPLVKAMTEGRPLIIDEIALIDPRVMSVVYSVMDGRDKLYVTANPERGAVLSEDGFVVYGACNPNAPGAIMSEALMSRFVVQIEMTTDWKLARTLGIDGKIITVARNLESKCAEQVVSAAPQLRELLAFRDNTTIFGESIALRNFVTQAYPEDREIYSEVIKSVFGVDVKPLRF